MKNHTLLSDIAIFLLIIFLFIVPPFFIVNVPSDNLIFSSWSFPWYQILLAIFGCALLYFYYEKTSRHTLIVFPVLFTFGMLFTGFLLSKFISEVVSNYVEIDVINKISVSKPKGVIQWIFCIINFLCAAFYEECLYRFYFPEALFRLITLKKTFRFSFLFCEVIGLLCFAFAHLYMGWISVFNAGLAHVFLRLCYKKTQKLWPCVASHFLYNVISLILL